MNNVKARLEILKRAVARMGPAQLRAILKTGESISVDGGEAIRLLYENRLAKVEAMDAALMGLADLINGLTEE